MPGCVKRDQPGVREEGVCPTHLIGQAASGAGTLFLLAQESAQPSADQPVQSFEDRVMGVLEVREPAPEHGVQTGYDLLQAFAAGPLGLGPDFLFELVQALLADES